MGQSERIASARIYYERGNGRAVIDAGPGSPRIEVSNVVMHGTFHTDHGEGPPKFWVVAENCLVRVIGDVAYVTVIR